MDSYEPKRRLRKRAPARHSDLLQGQIRLLTRHAAECKLPHILDACTESIACVAPREKFQTNRPCGNDHSCSSTLCARRATTCKNNKRHASLEKPHQQLQKQSHTRAMWKAQPAKPSQAAIPTPTTTRTKQTTNHNTRSWTHQRVSWHNRAHALDGSQSRTAGVWVVGYDVEVVDDHKASCVWPKADAKRPRSGYGNQDKIVQHTCADAGGCRGEGDRCRRVLAAVPNQGAYMLLSHFAGIEARASFDTYCICPDGLSRGVIPCRAQDCNSFQRVKN